MTALFLSPHNDDSALFGAFTLLRYRPFVITVLRSQVQEDRGTGVTAAVREAEDAAAMSILGCDWEQQHELDNNPDWWMVEQRLTLAHGVHVAMNPSVRVFAPAVEEGGHPHHNRVGEIADAVFGSDRVTHYMTYTNGRSRSEGVPVPFENEWIGRKLCALAQYESQHRLESTAHHFLQGLHEWYEAP